MTLNNLIQYLFIEFSVDVKSLHLYQPINHLWDIYIYIYIEYSKHINNHYTHTVVSSPGHLFPLVSLSTVEGQLIELSEEVMRNMLLIIILSAEDKLDPLWGSVCRQE